MVKKIGENEMPPRFYRSKSGKPLILPPMRRYPWRVDVAIVVTFVLVAFAFLAGAYKWPF